MIISKKELDEIIKSQEESKILESLDGYIQKYTHLLRGMCPDSNEDTILFLRMIETENLDPLEIIDYCSNIESEVLKPHLIRILKTSYKKCISIGQFQIRFRSNLKKWLKAKLNE